MRDDRLMEPVRIHGGSSRTPLAIGVLVLAGVVAVGAAPQFLGSGGQSAAVPPATADPSTAGAFSVVRVPSPAPPTDARPPSYPPTADESSEFWVEIRRQGRVLRRVQLIRRPDGSQTGTIQIPVAWRTRPPIIALFGRTVPADPASRLFSIRLALPETPRLGPALNLAGGLTTIVDPIPSQGGSVHPIPIIGYTHSWSYSADLQWAIAGGPELIVTVAPQLGMH
jgi:hypothetical protein